MIQLIIVPAFVLVVYLLAIFYSKVWGSDDKEMVGAIMGATIALAFLLTFFGSVGAHIFAPDTRVTHSVTLHQADGGEWFWEDDGSFNYYYKADDGVREGKIDKAWYTPEKIWTDDSHPKVEWDTCNTGWTMFTIDDERICAYRVYLYLDKEDEK